MACRLHRKTAPRSANSAEAHGACRELAMTPDSSDSQAWAGTDYLLYLVN